MKKDIDFSELLKSVSTQFSLNDLTNQFLFDNVSDENFDEAKEELQQLFKIARENPEERIEL